MRECCRLTVNVFRSSIVSPQRRIPRRLVSDLVDGTIYTQIVRPPLSSRAGSWFCRLKSSADNPLVSGHFTRAPRRRDSVCSGQWFSLLLLTPLAYAVFSQRKHSSGVESYGLDSTSISGLLPLTDLSSGIALFFFFFYLHSTLSPYWAPNVAHSMFSVLVSRLNYG